MRDTDGSNGNGGWSAPDTAVGKACHRLFNELTGSARPPQADFRRLLVAPTNMLDRFLALIAREADHARRGEGRGGRIRAELHRLAHAALIPALDPASPTRVGVELGVRRTLLVRAGGPRP